jgi:acetylornithine aminotransferase/acetylornithine/N-succinyldiaminopimelate aminotransferase
MHGTTFGGGPLACNVAIAVIDAMRQGEMLQQISETGGYFKEQLKELAKKHASIIDVRGMGLMLAAELDSADMAKDVVAQMLERHILINRTSETALRFLPPYILREDDVNTAIAALNEILTGLEATATGAHLATSSHERRN